MKEYIYVPNELLDDPRVSWMAKGLWIQLEAFDFVFSEEQLLARKTGETLQEVRTALAELEQFGYIKAVDQ